MSGRAGFGAQQTISMDNTRKMIDNAFKQRNLKAVLLSVNSPGGSAVQSDLVSSYIKAKAEKAKVDVIVFVEDTAGSGGYWLACTGKEIYACRSSVVGSIGVISQGLGFHKLIEKYDIERRTFTAGENKSVLDPLAPIKETDLKIIRSLLNNIHQHFIDHVKESRGTRLTAEDKVLFNGEFWTAKPALELGLIDGIDTLDAYVERNYGDTVKVYRAKKGGGLSSLFETFLPYLPFSAALPGVHQALPVADSTQLPLLTHDPSLAQQNLNVADFQTSEIAKTVLK
eukprot:TRINITY_DN49213_c0_g1_i1.p1 TRINITY_DN49213_c0_g1~~TRINITY_DN49213_c0_g1_i1.p1  ORF type:complete len:300 (+),score=33.67 TRINITY_DN49213_c0_g1_i1:49-900(+)